MARDLNAELGQLLGRLINLVRDFQALAATAPAATAEPSEDLYFGVPDEVYVTRAESVMNDAREAMRRRLEGQGLLVSLWREENKRNKRFYRLTPDGETLLGQLLGEWESLNASLRKIL